MLSSYFFSKPWQLVQDKMQLYICENIDNCKWYKFFVMFDIISIYVSRRLTEMMLTSIKVFKLIMNITQLFFNCRCKW